ncbi:hypothetical protein FQP85_08450 [Pseudoalteromonas neustonica]|uniref:Uncharacterized protein n=1 Tax=Pseudoalteromonas neustonica TaxID=1840331 RepID=A0ABY3FEA6_9GAMM|nr:hypothetical protein [Pseudoalteromonas neustonica]TVU83796.1 hypothetical protein FQP85_08450 [Pseudoalteromonas neustonica]
MMVNYPLTLPLPRLKEVSYKRQSNILRTEMGSGRARQRRRFLSVPTFMEATWRFKKDEAVAFEGFVDHGVQLTGWFLMDILTPKGVVKHQVRFKKDPLENFKPISALVWQYQAQVEVKEYKAASEEEAAISLVKPHTVASFVSSISNSINNYLEYNNE